jgi:hypothetical protein
MRYCARAYDRAGKVDEARRSWAAVLAYDPQHVEAIARLEGHPEK